jgi:hypothetical protein
MCGVNNPRDDRNNKGKACPTRAVVEIIRHTSTLSVPSERRGDLTLWQIFGQRMENFFPSTAFCFPSMLASSEEPGPNPSLLL